MSIDTFSSGLAHFVYLFQQHIQRLTLILISVRLLNIWKDSASRDMNVLLSQTLVRVQLDAGMYILFKGTAC